MQANIITIANDGCILTKRGTPLYNSLRSTVSKVHLIDAKQLALDKVSAAVSVKNAGRLIRRGIEQRDAAIKAGATGACTLVLQGREFLMPMSEGEKWSLTQDDLLYQKLKNLFGPKQGDVVVICSAQDGSLAEQGAMAAALTLVT